MTTTRFSNKQQTSGARVRVAAVALCMTGAGAALPAIAGNEKHSAPAARPSAPHVGGGGMGGGVHMPGGMGGGGVHMPGGMGGGAHMPSGMAGGAHVPGSMGGGAHVPGSMAGGAHMPGSMAGGAHVPGSMAGGAHVPGGMAGGAHVPGQTAAASRVHAPGAGPGGAGARTAGAHPAGTQTASREVPGERAGARGSNSLVTPSHGSLVNPAHGGGHGGGRAEAGLHGPEGREHAGGPEGREHAGGPEGRGRNAGAEGREREAGAHGSELARHDPRLGGDAKLHTRGLEAGMAAHHEPRPFLHAEAHRDIGRDRDFVGRHEHDFHVRDVRGFNRFELARWRGGLWRNEWHYGRRGWWWDVGGVWYPYADPIWPYPLEVAALTVYDTDTVVGPDLAVEEAMPPPDGYAGPVAGQAPGGIPPLPPAPAGSYRCADPNGYFPGVGACDQPWDLVAGATMPDAPPPNP